MTEEELQEAIDEEGCYYCGAVKHDPDHTLCMECQAAEYESFGGLEDDCE